MRTTLTALGAYGRKPTQADWNDGKDFRVYHPFGGPYFSIRDKDRFKADGYTEIGFFDQHGNCLFKEVL